MPPRKRTSSVLNGDSAMNSGAETDPTPVQETTTSVNALSLAEEAEAEAAEADALAAAARARARAIRLRREAEATTVVPAVATPAVEVEPDNVLEAEPEAVSVDETADEDTDETAPAWWRRVRLPRPRLAVVAAGVVVLCMLGLLISGGYMIWRHNQVVAEQQRSAEFAAAARQGVVTLMSLDFNHAADDVKRIVDNTTGDFKKDFEGQSADFIKVAQQSKVVTEAIVNATAVQSMTSDTATVLVAVTTRVSNLASKDQQPRSWRLSVDLARDGGQLKLAKVEFVP